MSVLVPMVISNFGMPVPANIFILSADIKTLLLVLLLAAMVKLLSVAVSTKLSKFGELIEGSSATDYVAHGRKREEGKRKKAERRRKKAEAIRMGQVQLRNEN